MASIKQRTIRWRTKDGEQKTAQRYQARYVDRNGQEHARDFKLKRDAQKWLDEQAAGMVSGLWVDPRAGRQLFRAYADAWLERQVVADATASSYEVALRKHIYDTLGGMRLDAITTADIQRLVKKWTGSAAAATVEQRYLILAMVLRSAVEDQVIARSPCKKIKLPRAEAKAALVPITTEVVVAMREALPERYRAFVTIGAGTGLRRGELLGLTYDRVSQQFGTVRVDRQLSRAATGKDVVFVPPKTTASVRTIPVADVVLEAITEHRRRFGQHETGLMFTTARGTPLRTSSLWMAWRAAAEQVGTDATPHDLRHYFASVQIAGGTSIKALQALLGHKSAVETWDTYGHLMGDEDGRSRAVIEDALGKTSDSSRTMKVRKIRLRRSEA